MRPSIAGDSGQSDQRCRSQSAVLPIVLTGQSVLPPGISPVAAGSLVLQLSVNFKDVSDRAAMGSRGLCVHEETHLILS